MEVDASESKESKSANDAAFNNMIASVINELEDILVVLKS
jgi:hypothetical protein